MHCEDRVYHLQSVDSFLAFFSFLWFSFIFWLGSVKQTNMSCCIFGALVSLAGLLAKYGTGEVGRAQARRQTQKRPTRTMQNSSSCTLLLWPHSCSLNYACVGPDAVFTYLTTTAVQPPQISEHFLEPFPAQVHEQSLHGQP